MQITRVEDMVMEEREPGQNLTPVSDYSLFWIPWKWTRSLYPFGPERAVQIKRIPDLVQFLVVGLSGTRILPPSCLWGRESGYGPVVLAWLPKPDHLFSLVRECVPPCSM